MSNSHPLKVRELHPLIMNLVKFKSSPKRSAASSAVSLRTVSRKTEQFKLLLPLKKSGK